ncbi:MAG: T9SS type A sorting domain-containing protein [bacterium]|nr:T9SS type A sorting domain-containing protein [bacterium]
MKPSDVIRVLAISAYSVVFATVRHVPADYPTIQLAVDAVQAGDTVLVATGIYAEAVITSSVFFKLIGESTVDSLRPIIDPSPLIDPTNISCLTWNGAACHIENFIFRNGPEMFPRTSTFTGGVVLLTSDAAFWNCSFDSTNTGIFVASPGTLTLDRCDFVECVNLSIKGESGALDATNCLFKRTGLTCGDGSRFMFCMFDSISPRYAMMPFGHLSLESCIFDHQNSPNWPLIDTGNLTPTIRDCIFRNCIVSRGIFFLQRDCTEDMLFENNLFENITASSEIGISWGCSSSETGSLVTFRNNTFLDIADGSGRCISSLDRSTVLFQNNRFINIGGIEPTIDLPNAHIVARENIFINTDFAIYTEHGSDARFNYWGDATGPFHPFLNPFGLGDEISDSILFDPWYPDSTLQMEVADFGNALPTEFQLSVYPNPFNGTARLSLFVPTSFIGSIELINTLGQRAQRGPLFGQLEYSVNADNLSSGIYFVTVRDVIKNSVESAQKIVLIR